MSDLTPARIRRAKGDLKISGLAYMAFGIWSILKVSIEMATGVLAPLNDDMFIEYGNTVIFISLIITMFLISGFILVLHFYIGFSALRFSKDPGSSRKFLYWAIIILVFYVIEIPYLIFSLIFLGDPSQDTTIASILLEITTGFILFDLIKSGFLLRKSIKESQKET